jgi:hypothetical protein
VAPRGPPTLPESFYFVRLQYQSRLPCVRRLELADTESIPRDEHVTDNPCHLYALRKISCIRDNHHLSVLRDVPGVGVRRDSAIINVPDEQLLEAAEAKVESELS